jgi:hypothetical protein
VDETLAKIQVQNFQMAGWTLIEEQFINIEANPQCIKVNA